MIKIYDYYLTHTHKKDQFPFPVISPLVFYTGRNLYKASRALWELWGSEAELMRQILSEPFHLIDVNTIPEHDLISRKWSGTMEFLMRYRFRLHVEQEFDKIAQNINYLMLNGKGQFVLQLLSYIMAIDEEHRSVAELTRLIHNKLSPDAEKEIMSLAEILRQEGKLDGELKRNIEIAKKMLVDGVEPAFVAKYTEMSLEEVKKLQKNIH